MNNNVVTIFSNTSYAGLNQNDASFLYIKRNGDIYPKVI
jgi:hypothetical protein